MENNLPLYVYKKHLNETTSHLPYTETDRMFVCVDEDDVDMWTLVADSNIFVKEYIPTLGLVSCTHSDQSTTSHHIYDVESDPNKLVGVGDDELLLAWVIRDHTSKGLSVGNQEYIFTQSPSKVEFICAVVFGSLKDDVFKVNINMLDQYPAPTILGAAFNQWDAVEKTNEQMEYLDNRLDELRSQLPENLDVYCHVMSDLGRVKEARELIKKSFSKEATTHENGFVRSFMR